MSEKVDKVFFSEGDVTVTRTRFVSHGDTYTMATVSSCKTRYSDETNGGKSFLRKVAIVISIGVGIAIGIASNFIVGIILGVVGIIAAVMFIKPGYKLYKLYLGTNSGELEAVLSKDENFIVQIERAVNDAIVERG